MSTEMVTVGCRLPSGITLEVGYTASVRGGNGRQPYARYVKGPKYQSVTLKGSNQHLIVRDQSRKVVALLPGRQNAEPFINQVPKDFWDQWCKEHSTSWLLTQKQLYVVAKNDGTEIAAATMDAQAASKAIFQPMDPNEVIDLDGAKVEKRTDE